MQFLPFIIAAGSLPLISGAPVASNLYSVSADVKSTHSLSGRSTSLYAGIFAGDGLTSQGWPSVSQWMSTFEDMWESNQEVMKASCGNMGYGDDNSEEEIADIKKAINAIASESSVDARYIFSIVMQESNGCVRVKTTDNGVINPGLMQSHNGQHACNNAAGDSPVSPCPYETIHGMISDGTTGTGGLKNCLTQYKDSEESATYYRAARCYNSGSVASNGNLGDGITSTNCYATDIANRLLGWATGTSNCNSGLIATLTSSQWDGASDSGSGSSGSSGSSGETSTSTSSSIPAATETFAPSTIVPTVVQTAQPTTTSAPAPAATTTEAPAPVAPTTTAAPTVVPSSAPAPAPSSSLAPGGNYGPYPYASKSCQQYYTVEANDYCRKIEVQYGITATDFQSLNPGLDNTCSNLWKGYQYCVKA
ncbi:hypothetical protein N7509_003108 [Penicillium cosmopolitanum]|uniref:LysM domain-containing protein n=1 Tax=Penicillium cosmopolitanum TaxID=1131564 RepID=A0A9W9W4K2_9EURO|nr:uncharacterized protein N7509_003108 [Penicillium cosmopolitanum]KAJ5403237.1 hypothetical protein N7509_003108 [Penicillium cosmopolitanum]